MVPSGNGLHRPRQRFVSRREIGHQGQGAHTHDVVGRQGRQHVGRVDIGQHTDGNRMGRVQMDDRPGIGALAIHAIVQEGLLGWSVAV
ncbi:hypothetical protein D3C86_2084800 [compost metagenome]